MAEFFAGFLAAFALGTFWFWAASAVAFIAILFFEEHENNIGAFIVLGIFIFLMEKSGAFNLFADPWMLIKWTLLYFVIGAVWSIFKWFSFLNLRAERFGELKQMYADKPRFRNIRDGAGERIPVDDVTVDYGTLDKPSEDFKKYLDDKNFISSYSGGQKTIVPLAKNNVDKLSTWILWWPCSALWTLLNDPLVRLAKAIVKRLNNIYDAMARKVFAKFAQ